MEWCWGVFWIPGWGNSEVLICADRLAARGCLSEGSLRKETWSKEQACCQRDTTKTRPRWTSCLCNAFERSLRVKGCRQKQGPGGRLAIACPWLAREFWQVEAPVDVPTVPEFLRWEFKVARRLNCSQMPKAVCASTQLSQGTIASSKSVQSRRVSEKVVT